MKLKISVALLAFVTAVIPLSLSAEDGLAHAVASRNAAQTYANLPLRFEPAAEQGHFMARSSGYAVLVGAGESAIAITDGKSGLTRALRFSFEGSNAAAQIEAIDALPGVTNYYIGSDPKNWRLGVRNFARLRTKNVYPGVDIVYYGDNRRLEFDFVVAPAADPRAIALALSGMDKLYINAEGELVAEVNGNPVRFAKPYAYQKVAGSTKAVSVEYALAGPGKVQLRIGDYDKNLELVIDPTLTYSTFLGGSNGDTGNGIAVDAVADAFGNTGYAYITGQTCSIGLDTGSHPMVIFPGGQSLAGTAATSDTCVAYVTKLDPTGAIVLYTTYIGGTVPTPAAASASGYGIALDNVALHATVPVVPNGNANPNVYIVGTTSFQDMPIVGYTADPNYPSISPNYPGGDYDPFIAILNSQTGALIRSTYLGGNGTDNGYAIAVDPQQNVIVAGKAGSFNFPTYNGFEPITEAYVAFVTKLDFGLHIAPPILPGASPMSPRVPSNTDTCGATCPSTPDPTKAYFFFSAVYGGQLVAPPATWPVAYGSYPNLPALVGTPPAPPFAPCTAPNVPAGCYPYPRVPYGAITTATPYNCPSTTSGTIYPAVRLFAQNAGYAEGINWGTCTSNVPSGNIIDASGISWLIIDVAGPTGFPSVVSAATEAYGVAIDSNSDVFAVGGSSTANLHPSLPGNLPNPGGYDWLPQAATYSDGTGAWIIKLHGHDTPGYPAGWPVKSYVTALEQNETKNGTVDAARGVAIDSQGSAYVVGTTTGTLLSATGLNQAPLGATDAFVLKMETPSVINYVTYLGGTQNDQGLAIAVGSGGYAYIAGTTESTIPVINAVVDGSGNTLNSLRGTQNAYLAKLTPDGTALIMSAYLGGCCLDSGNAIALSKTGNGDIFVAGTTNSTTNFPIVPREGPTNDVLGRSAMAGTAGNAFVTRISGASFPILTLSTTNLVFPNQAEYWATTSVPTSWNTVTITNSGTGTLNFTSSGSNQPAITASGDFSVSNNTCGTPPNAQLAAGDSCFVTVVFTPSQANSRSGDLTINDDVIDSPQKVGLSGLGVLVGDTVSTNPATSPVILTFGSTTVGATSAPQSVTVTNTDTNGQTLTVSASQPNTTSTAPGPEFSLSSNGCVTNLTPGQSCTISVVFTPSATASQSGTLIINGNGQTFPATVLLNGTGNGPQGQTGGTTSTSPTFTLTPLTSSMAVTAGAQMPLAVTLTAVNGFSQQVTLTCAGLGGASCSPATKTSFVNTTSPSTINFTVNVGGGKSVTVTELMRPGRLLACLLPFGGIGLVLAGRRKRWLLAIGLAMCLALVMAACGGGSSTSPGTTQPQVTVTATSQDGQTTQTATYYLNAS
ncbi:MAG: choice-of-anchor D domain-containing protein [Candidatus Korobacteraceae bacterium]